MRTLARGCASAVVSLVILGSTGCISFGFLPGKALRNEASGYVLKPGGLVELKTFNGRIKVRANPEAGVRLETAITCRARSDQEAEQGVQLITPRVMTEEGRLVVEYDQPDGRSYQYSVNLEAWVPESSTVILRTSNGTIEIEGIRGDLQARTSNARVIARDAGRAQAVFHSSNGRIIAERVMGAVDAQTSNAGIEARGCSGPLDLVSSNGSVEVEASSELMVGGIRISTSNARVWCRLPASFDGEVDVHTSNARISSDFPLTRSSRDRGERNTYSRLGGGGPLVKVRTSNGNVKIERAGGSGARRSERSKSPPPPVEQTAEVRKV